MKRFLKQAAGIVFSLLCILTVFTATALADVIIEPFSPFYDQHRSECRHEDRTYIANAPGGTLTGYESPESSKEEFHLENGQAIFTSFVYEAPDGNAWGYSDYYNAWYPLEYTYVKYDDLLFRENYEVTQESGTLSDEYHGKAIYFWDYPGGNVTSWWSVPEGEQLPGYYGTFKDENGLTWGYVGYYFGRRNSWVCLDKADLKEEELYPGEKPVRDTRFIETPELSGKDPITPNTAGQSTTIGIVLAAVAAVMGASILMLLHVRK